MQQAYREAAFSDADLNVAKAAQHMHVHPNTVRYRLEQIATKTAHDPRTFTGLVDLICILEMTDDQRATAHVSEPDTDTDAESSRSS